MENFLDVIVISFIIDILVDVLAMKIFKIKIKFWFLIFMQIPKLCVTIIFCFVKLKTIYYLLIKTFSRFFAIIFLTDSFKFGRLFWIYFTENVLLFSIEGVSKFLILCFKSVIKNAKILNYLLKYDYFVAILLFLYIFMIFKLVRFIEKNKILKQHLAKVSFVLNDKHIDCYGLVDSGNCLFDPLTRKPVILFSCWSLNKFLSQGEIDELIFNRCRFIDCDTISGSGFKIPIMEMKNLKVIFKNFQESCDCMVGFVESKFENGKYGCLLHRDFL